MIRFTGRMVVINPTIVLLPNAETKCPWSKPHSNPARIVAIATGLIGRAYGQLYQVTVFNHISICHPDASVN